MPSTSLLICFIALVGARNVDVSKDPQCGKHGSQADGLACNPVKHARTLLQHLASGTGSVLAEETPEGIVQYTKDYIDNTLLPQAEATTRELQSGLDNAVQAFDTCSSALTDEDSRLSQQETTLITAEQRHNECENNVAQQNRSMEAACSELNEFASNLEAPEDAREVNGSSPDACLVTLVAMNSFYNEVYPAFMEKKKACEVATGAEQATAEQCAADKSAIEESWCGLRAARTEACNNLKTCYNSKTTSFNSVIDMTKLLEENTKNHVQKYVDACVQHNDCTAGTIDLAKLSVTYPTKPSSMECDATIKSDWDYSHVQCAGDDQVSPSGNEEVDSEQPEQTAQQTTNETAFSQGIASAEKNTTADSQNGNASAGNASALSQGGVSAESTASS